MYFSLGNDSLLRKTELLAIFDMDNATWSHLTRATLRRAEKDGAVVDAAGGELPKSFILCGAADGKRKRIYLSQLNPSTLARRYEETEVRNREE